LSQNTFAVGAHFDDASNNRFAETYIYRLKFDNAPYLTTSLPDQVATPNVPFTYTIPSGTFADVDINDSVTMSLSVPPTPPAWLNFNPTNGTFTGTPDFKLGTFPIAVRGTDLDGASVILSFNIILGGTNGLTPLDQWRLQYFPPIVLSDPSLEATVWGNNADPDGDGAPNIMEYVFGTNPTSADPGDTAPLQIFKTANPATVMLVYKRRTDDWRLVYTIETATSFGTWQPLDPGQIVNETTAGAGTGVQQVNDEVSNIFAGQYFRLRVRFLAPEF
jgi:hypothetical protein